MSGPKVHQSTNLNYRWFDATQGFLPSLKCRFYVTQGFSLGGHEKVAKEGKEGGGLRAMVSSKYECVGFLESTKQEKVSPKSKCSAHA